MTGYNAGSYNSHNATEKNPNVIVEIALMMESLFGHQQVSMTSKLQHSCQEFYTLISYTLLSLHSRRQHFPQDVVEVFSALIALTSIL